MSADNLGAEDRIYHILFSVTLNSDSTLRKNRPTLYFPSFLSITYKLMRYCLKSAKAIIYWVKCNHKGCAISLSEKQGLLTVFNLPAWKRHQRTKCGTICQPVEGRSKTGQGQEYLQLVEKTLLEQCISVSPHSSSTFHEFGWMRFRLNWPVKFT